MMSIKIIRERVAIVIPAYNESESIASVVEEVSLYGVPIVVNDCSIDNTGELAKEFGAIVVEHEVNLGYDLSLASGLAKSIAEAFDFAVTVDGDGQHQSSDIEAILRKLADGGDLVVGIRDHFQRFSEAVFSVLSTKLWGISDPLCGMKGYRISKLMSVGALYSYPSIGTELAIKAVRSGWEIRQVPITTRQRRGQSRFGSGIYANSIILKAMLIGVIGAGIHTCISMTRVKPRRGG